MNEKNKVLANELYEMYKDFPWFFTVGVGNDDFYVYCKKKPPKNSIVSEYKGCKVTTVVTGEVKVDMTEKAWKKRS